MKKGWGKKIKRLGIIIKIISNNYTVKEDKEVFVCQLRGIFRKQNIVPLVGDKVRFDAKLNLITEILPRRNELIRPAISNVDQVLIIISVKEPELDLYLLDKLLLIVTINKITPIICFTKLDLLTKIEYQQFKEYYLYYQKLGYLVFTNQELEQIKKLFKAKITVFAGASGVGKSTLLNQLEPSLKLKTAPISKALRRGKHTTRHIELFNLGSGLGADTPGFSMLEFSKTITPSMVRAGMLEFKQYASICEYRNCFHKDEVNCKVKAMVEKKEILITRYENYLKFLKELKEVKKW